MSYHIYTTEALVLSHKPLREVDRIYSVLTPELGLLKAGATGVRKEVSKLRASLEPYSFTNVSFVKGKEYWRITNASLDYNIVNKVNDDKTMQSIAKVLSLLEKLVVGEQGHPQLLKDLRECIDFSINKAQGRHKDLEVLMVARILWELGYISSDEVSLEILKPSPTLEILDRVKEERKNIIRSINNGLKASELA